jgi:hypothetical protein
VLCWGKAPFIDQEAESSITRLWMGRLRCRPQAHGLWMGLIGWAPTIKKMSGGHCARLSDEMGLAMDSGGLGSVET